MEEINMKKIYCPTELRGFQKHLFKTLEQEYEIKIKKDSFYDKISLKKKLLSKLIRSKIMDFLGVIRVIKITEKNDLIFSYNRFIKNTSPYIINLENPTALYHYSLKRNRTFLGKRKLKKEILNENLKKIVCISKACYETVYPLLGEKEVLNKIIQIYPYIEDKNLLDIELKNKSLTKKVRCLYISSEFYLKGGKEILEAIKLLKFQDIEFFIVTETQKIKSEDLEEIKADKRIKLIEFNLNFEELNKLYSLANILLHPTRQDSFALVILEAMKNGLPCIATSLYAIPELIQEGYNGFLIENKYLFFNKDNLPNPNVWNNRKKTIYSYYYDENIVKFLVEKITLYYENRQLLYEHSIASYLRSKNKSFSSEKIKIKWENLINDILKEGKDV